MNYPIFAFLFSRGACAAGWHLLARHKFDVVATFDALSVRSGYRRWVSEQIGFSADHELAGADVLKEVEARFCGLTIDDKVNLRGALAKFPRVSTTWELPRDLDAVNAWNHAHYARMQQLFS